MLQVVLVVFLCAVSAVLGRLAGDYHRTKLKPKLKTLNPGDPVSWAVHRCAPSFREPGYVVIKVLDDEGNHVAASYMKISIEKAEFLGNVLIGNITGKLFKYPENYNDLYQ